MLESRTQSLRIIQSGGNLMRGSIKMKSLMLSVVAALLLAVAVPSSTLAQGKGQGKGLGKGHGNGDWADRIDRNRSSRNWRNRRGSNYDKKCGKFVNCHDARDGRIDGRGPSGTRVSNRLRNRTWNDTWRNRTRRGVRRVIVNP